MKKIYNGREHFNETHLKCHFWSTLVLVRYFVHTNDALEQTNEMVNPLRFPLDWISNSWAWSSSSCACRGIDFNRVASHDEGRAPIPSNKITNKQKDKPDKAERKKISIEPSHLSVAYERQNIILGKSNQLFGTASSNKYEYTMWAVAVVHGETADWISLFHQFVFADAMNRPPRRADALTGFWL